MTTILRCGVCGASKGLRTEIGGSAITCPKGHRTDGHRVVRQTLRQARQQSLLEEKREKWESAMVEAKKVWGD